MRRNLNIDDVFFAAQYVWGFNKEQILSKNKVGSYSFSRHCIAYYLYTETQMTYMQIGKLMERHYASIINSIRKVNDMVETKYKPFLHDFNRFKMIIESRDMTGFAASGGDVEKDGKLKFYRNGKMVIYDGDKFTVVNDNGISKLPFDKNKSVIEFISTLLSIT